MMALIVVLAVCLRGAFVMCGGILKFAIVGRLFYGTCEESDGPPYLQCEVIVTGNIPRVPKTLFTRVQELYNRRWSQSMC